MSSGRSGVLEVEANLVVERGDPVGSGRGVGQREDRLPGVRVDRFDDGHDRTGAGHPARLAIACWLAASS
jgi:hypothetical protein